MYALCVEVNTSQRKQLLVCGSQKCLRLVVVVVMVKEVCPIDSYSKREILRHINVCFSLPFMPKQYIYGETPSCTLTFSFDLY